MTTTQRRACGTSVGVSKLPAPGGASQLRALRGPRSCTLSSKYEHPWVRVSIFLRCQTYHLWMACTELYTTNQVTNQWKPSLQSTLNRIPRPQNTAAEEGLVQLQGSPQAPGEAAEHPEDAASTCPGKLPGHEKEVEINRWSELQERMLLNPVCPKCDHSTRDPHKNGDGQPFPSYRVFKLPWRRTAARTPQPGLAAKVSRSAALEGHLRERALQASCPAHSSRPGAPSSFRRLRRSPTAPLGRSRAEHGAGWSADFKATCSKAKSERDRLSRCLPGLPTSRRSAHPPQECGARRAWRPGPPHRSGGGTAVTKMTAVSTRI